ncbi:hypothetical protein SAMN05518684_106222 [Salipaludibacillus aurantiacus]|uniref:PARP alpha-helical domain-containing protein n=1 Tax=Salipaludibacillus aurantiacus TaxID=1601833 RepID=A0A1H9U0S8_9BACI|nr:hypothetical protein SAMN05518684_106222 [Salipaludibacillus aurantiacus]
MYLRLIVERERMIQELQAMHFYEFEGRPLEKLGYNQLKRAYVRLPELKELEA